MPDRTIERSSLEEEVFSRLPREAAELVAQLLLEAGDEASRARSEASELKRELFKLQNAKR